MKHSRQRGASLIIVLVVLTALLLGAVSMARLNETTNLIAGNIAFKDGAIQASEVGISEAFANLGAIADEEADQGGWYFASVRGDDASGLPANVDWTAAAQTVVGKFTVRYVVERQCVGAMPVVNVNYQCLIKRLPTTGSAKAGMESLELPVARQYRLTISVAGPKNTKTFVQTMVVR